MMPQAVLEAPVKEEVATVEANQDVFAEVEVSETAAPKVDAKAAAKALTESLTFNDFAISDALKAQIATFGYEKPSPIQQEAIPLALAGRDVLGQAQTGSGKTMAFAIPSVERLNPSLKAVQTLVLCPTRELANQVALQFEALTNGLLNLSVAILVGGQPMPPQLRSLKMGAQVVVGTPGRVMDHLERGSLKLENCNCFILDEADEMLDMGFREDIESIFTEFEANDHQTLLFSATMSSDIKNIANRFLKNPATVNLLGEKRQAPAIDQRFMVVFPELRNEVLVRLLTLYESQLTVVFSNTKREVDELVAFIKARGIMAEGLHGDLSQVMRDKAMNSFRSGVARVLVATDVAGRGMDVSNVGLVVNYDLPRDDEDYVHRVGRTGRAGKTGVAYTFIGTRQLRKMNELMRRYKLDIQETKPPMAEALNELCLKAIVTNLRKELQEPSQEQKVLRSELFNELKEEGWTLEHILEALVSQQMSLFQQRFDFELEPKLARVGQRPERRFDGENRGFDRPAGGGGYRREGGGGYGGGGERRSYGGGGGGRSYGGGNSGGGRSYGGGERSGGGSYGGGGGRFSKDTHIGHAGSHASSGGGSYGERAFGKKSFDKPFSKEGGSFSKPAKKRYQD